MILYRWLQNELGTVKHICIMRGVSSRLSILIINEGSVYMNTQMKKGVLELCVLSMLSRGDRYGYELTESLSEEMSIAPGTLYLILKRLKDDECVETYLVESEAGPARKYYHLTDKGNETLLQQKNDWQQFIRIVEKFIGE